MKRFMIFFVDSEGLRSGKGLRLSGVVVMALLICLFQPSYSSAGYVFDQAWPALAGQFNNPSGVAVDSLGNVYVADMDNHRILKFDANGENVTKWGSYGTANGQFGGAYGLAVDSSGNVYVADTGNNRIQKFTSSGTFVKKWGTMGTGDGQFNLPMAVAVDELGNVYVADADNERIQMFDTNGTYLTQWGSYGSGNGQFDWPMGVAAGDGYVWVADRNNNRIQRFRITGTYVQYWAQWGSHGTGQGQFDWPTGVAWAAGSLYVTDTGNHRIQTFSGAGYYTATWGSLGTGVGQFNTPWGVAVYGTGVYVADMYNNRIQKFGSGGAYWAQWGGAAAGNGQFSEPWGVAVDYNGEVHVADTGNNRIQTFTANGVYQRQWGSNGTGNSQFSGPVGLAAEDYVYVADLWNSRIQKFSSGGGYAGQWGSFGTANGQFSAPIGVAVDGYNKVYVADYGNNRIQKFTSTGEYVAQWGVAGNGNGQFSYPFAVVVDILGTNVYVADYGNNRIQKFTSTGEYVAQWGVAGTGNGQFNSPSGMALDSSGNVYVADTGNNRVQKFTPSGKYVTQWGSLGSGYGQFNKPAGVAVDSSGNVYVADMDNNRIQKFRYVDAPTLGALTPSVVTSAANVAKDFSAVYEDTAGYADLKNVYLLVNTTESKTNAICVRYNGSLNKLYLRNDANTADVSNCTPGVPGLLMNTQGTLDCEATTVSGTENILTVNWNITPTAAFVGTKNLYMYAGDNSGATVGWTDKGNWTIFSNVAPVLGTLTPSVVTSLVNVAKGFSAVYSDANGYADLNIVNLRVGPLANGINVRYNRSANKLYLRNDANTTDVGNCTPGVAGTLTNTQGTLDCGATTKAVSGNELTVNWNIKPKAGFTGTKTIYMYAKDKTGETVGWTDKGNWTISSNAAPVIRTLTPSVVTSAANTAKGFSAVYGDANGYADLKIATFLINTTANKANAICVRYDMSTNKLYLRNDTNTADAGSCTPGVSGTLTNTRGSLICAATTVSGTGKSLTINWNIKPKAAFAGTKNLYMSVSDKSGATAGLTDKGDWTITAP